MGARSGRYDGVLVAACALAACLVLLARHGVVFTPDSDGFIAQAGALLAGGEFYRPPLYPLVIAAAQAVAGLAWPWLVVFLQLGLAALATVRLHGALAELTGVRWLAALGAAAQAGSFVLAVAPAILADSLYASLWCIGFASLLRAGAGPGLTVRGAFALGCLLGAMTWLREVGTYTHLLWLPLLAVAARGGPGQRLVIVLAALVPMLAGPALLVALNGWRTGTPYLTTVGRIVFLQALLPLAAKNLPVFATDPLLAQAAAASMPPVDLPGVGRINTYLIAAGLDVPAVTALARAAWAAAWRDFPLAMAAAAANRIKAHHLLTLFLPMENVGHVTLWATGTPPLIARFDRLVRAATGSFAPDLVPLALVAAACRVVAVVLAAAFLATPLRALGRVRTSQGARLALAAWPILPGTLLLHALVHLEIRYFAPAMPAAIAAACWTLAHLPLGRRRALLPAEPGEGNACP